MRPSLLMLIGIVFASAFAMAQKPENPPGRIELFGGYTYVTPDFSLVSGNGVKGWNASVDFKVRRWIGFVGDASGFYARYTYPPLAGSTQARGDSYSLLFGPQLSIQRGRFGPFGRFLTGVTHVGAQTIAGFSENLFKSDNAWSYAVGGGLDYSVTRHFAIRGSADMFYVRLTPIGGGDPGANYVKNRTTARISTGVVVRF